MNVLQLNKWIVLLLFTIPCILFSEITSFISISYSIFFVFYYLFLTRLTSTNKNEGFLVRNKIECLLLLIAFSVAPICYALNKEFKFSYITRTVFSFSYFGVSIDISLGFGRFI